MNLNKYSQFTIQDPDGSLDKVLTRNLKKSAKVQIFHKVSPLFQ